VERREEKRREEKRRGRQVVLRTSFMFKERTKDANILMINCVLC